MIARTLAAPVFLLMASCGQEGAPAPVKEASVESDLAADTASLPNSDIFLAALSLAGERPQLEGLHNVTQAAGYDNQPSFLPGVSKFYFVSEGVSGKTDIWKYNIDTDQKAKIYHSPTISEYSPRAAPNGFGISFIQENEAGDMTRVHTMSASGGEGRAVVSFAPLGYYAWLADATKLGVFYRSEPATLQLVDIASGDAEEIASNIGRSLQAAPDGNGLYFTQGDGDAPFSVMYLDLRDNSTAHVTSLPDGSQDYFIVFSGGNVARGMFVGAGSVLYFLDMAIDDAVWSEVADFASDGLGNISRIAVSDDASWITMVAEAQ